MSCLMCFLFLLAVASGVRAQGGASPSSVPSPPGGFYTTRYDHIDVENILNQKRLVYYYSECLLDRRPCTPQGIEFKRILPEALRTNCLRCTEKQRFVTLKSIKRLMKEYPEIWAQLAEVWDPTGDYVKILEESLNNKKKGANLGAETQVQNTLVKAPENKQDDNVGKVNLESRFGETDSTTSANTIANKPISFTTISSTSTTTSNPIIKRAQEATTVLTTSTKTAKPAEITTKLSRKVETKRVNYNYDFSLTVKPPVLHHANGLNIVLKGVNNIIAPITDIAGKVITASTDLAGMVLNAFGVKKT